MMTDSARILVVDNYDSFVYTMRSIRAKPV